MELIELTGAVLLAQPVGEYDKRLVILTGERGKVTAFAHGARRPNNALMAASNPFVFGTFLLAEGRTAYTLRSAEVVNYFSELPMRQPEVYYGFYFLELASYWAQEGMECTEMVDLLYITLRALMKGRQSPDLIRSIYECRLMTVNGVFAPPETPEGMDESAWYALSFVSSCSLAKLYSFGLSAKAERDFTRAVRRRLSECVDRKLKSLAMLTLSSTQNFTE